MKRNLIIISLLLILVLAFLSAPVLAKNNGKGNPFQELWDSLEALQEYVDDAIADLQQQIDNIQTGKPYALDAYDGSPTDVVYVDEDGNVGIGTTTPTETLDVSGTIEADDFQYSTPRLHILTIPAQAFVPEQNVEEYYNRDGAYVVGANDIRMVAPVYLPDGARVVDMIGHFYDNSSRYDISVWLTEIPLLTPPPSHNILATASSTGEWGYMSAHVPVFDHTIDNMHYSYHVAVNAPWNETGGETRLMGVRLGYFMDGPS